VHLVALQFDIVWEDKPANFATVRRWLSQADLPQPSLVVLPEMFATGFSMDVARLAENPGGATEQFLAETARRHGICLVAGAAMRGRDGQARNKALIFGPTGELLGFYAKMQLFTPGGEAEHYAAGEHTVGCQWEGLTFCPFICYDLRFPELFRQAVARHQPEVCVVIANFPTKRISHWIRLLQARAIENQAYVVGVNRVGHDPHYTYNGHSLIIDPHGEILADAGEGECCIQAKLDLASLREYRAGLPFLRDMKEGRTGP
jgi:predicted amidohydrolase